MRWCLYLLTALLIQVRAVAWETDQFTLSDQPIAELGEEVSTYVFNKLQITIQQVSYYKNNSEIEIKHLKTTLSNTQTDLKKLNSLTDNNDVSWKRQRLRNNIEELKVAIKESKKLLVLSQTEQGIVELIAKAIANPIAVDEKRDAIWRGIPSFINYPLGTKAGLSISYQPDRFKTTYAFAGFHRVLHPSHFIFSSTIKLYGIEMGMDRLGHIFNEGFHYYQYFSKAKKSGFSYSNALKKAVDWGIESENSYYGMWVSGIYSNADLASNYVGLHFYLNLFYPLHLNGVIYPAMLSQDKDGEYNINSSVDNQAHSLLKRFISNHMNEAFNPSSLEYLQYIIVQEAVKNRCDSWQAKYPNRLVLNNEMANLILWNGDDYGFNASNTVSIYESCFSSLEGSQLTL